MPRRRVAIADGMKHGMKGPIRVADHDPARPMKCATLVASTWEVGGAERIEDAAGG